MPPRTLLKDVEKLRQLHDIIFRFFRFLPVSNFFSETVVKTLVKTLHPTQRREESTASRWVAALHRDTHHANAALHLPHDFDLGTISSDLPRSRRSAEIKIVILGSRGVCGVGTGLRSSPCRST